MDDAAEQDLNGRHTSSTHLDKTARSQLSGYTSVKTNFMTYRSRSIQLAPQLPLGTIINKHHPSPERPSHMMNTLDPKSSAKVNY